MGVATVKGARHGRRLLVVVLLLLGVASAQQVTIDTFDDPFARLELRTVPLPGGEERTIYVISAERVELAQEGLLVVASRLEFDPTAGTARIIGRGRVERPGETLVGEDMLIELSGGRLDGNDVVVITDTVYVVGEQAQRVEGRISVMQGRLAPCAQCGPTVEDYAFMADRIEILPGDRLIAWDAVLLIREAPFLPFPLLVLPIAEPNRSPRLVIESGTADERAEVRVDWPYVSGPNAYGTFTARLLIRVDPERGAFLDGRLLGGRPEHAALAGAIDHRFYDARGAGRVTFSYLPELEDAEGNVTGERTVRFGATYDTDAASGDPRLSFRVARDDAARPDLLEVEGSTSTRLSTFRATLRTQLAIPLVMGVTPTPSWDGGGAPRTTPLQFTLAGGDATRLQIGTLRIEGVNVDLGVFEDAPDPTNRSAITRALATTGRIQANHVTTLDATRLLGFVTLSGENRFQGRYYATGERQVDWSTSLRTSLEAGSIAGLNVTWRRETREGETPFAFERISLRTRSDLQASFSLTPFDGYALTGSGGWIFVDDRAPDEEGWTPTTLTLEAFGNVPALAFSAVHRANPRIEDVGTLEVTASLRYPGDRYVAAISGSHLQDLDTTQPQADRGAEPNDATNGSGTIQLGIERIAVASIETGWDVDREAEDEEDLFTWESVTTRATLGTSDRGDRIPALEARWTFDPEVEDLRETSRVSYDAAIDVGAIRLELAETYGPAETGVGSHRLSLFWDDLVRADLEGVTILPGDVLQLPADPTASRPVTVTLQDAGGIQGIGFRARYRGTFVPTDEEGWERRDSAFEATLRLSERSILGDRVQAVIDAFVDVPLPDDVQPEPFLRRANLAVGMDVFGRVGLQGTFGYAGRYDRSSEEVTSGRLAFESVSLTVQATRELYVGATLNDVWELIDEEPSSDLEFDPRPTFFAAWDRCCWALYTQWDTRTGEIVITLGRPGTREGRVLGFEEGPTIPWGTEDTP